MNGEIVLKNVRTHNLKEIDVLIPHRSLVVITGVSGSGKSSLAFDTLYAEGRRRYVESLSTYARQFLERIEKPDLESVSGILPAIAIEAKNVITNARSTVGTQTELNDYLRLLFARIGETYCTGCGRKVVSDNASGIFAQIEREFKHQRVSIAFPLVLGKNVKRFSKEMKDEFNRQGFLNFIVSGRLLALDEASNRIKEGAARVLVVLDTLDFDEAHRSRAIESMETALRFGSGKLSLCFQVNGEWQEHRFSNRFHCAQCDIEFREPNPNMFSFNSPLGACAECQGFGRIITIDWNLVVPDPKRSILGGAIEPWTKPSAAWELRQLKAFCREKKIPLDVPFRELKTLHRQWILEGLKGNDYFSVRDFFKYLEKKTYKMHIRIFLSKYRGYQLCPACRGARIKREALAVHIHQKNIADLMEMTIEALKHFFDTLPLSKHDEEVARPILLEIRNRLSFLTEIGVGYLSLGRLSRTLSGGESQRIRLAASLGSALVDTLYVLDEPSVGLHDRDNVLLIRLLNRLKDLGNTVVVVEHDRTMIEAADQLIDLGPLGGEKGGRIVFQGPFEQLMSVEGSETARYFRGELRMDRTRSEKNGYGRGVIGIRKASEHNLKNISVEIPLHQLTVITGVSGSGKSTFMYDVLYANYQRLRGRAVQSVGCVERIEGWKQVHDMLLIDQSPIGRTPRSNPVTYLKAFDYIRKIFASTRDAKERKLTAGDFSFNVPGGRCTECEGDGVQKIEMYFLADVHVTCEACGGARYQSVILEVRYKGKNIREVLDLTVDEALNFFGDHQKICASLSLLSQVGLGHLRLGQSATTFSGGEAQRLKLAAELARGSDMNGRVNSKRPVSSVKQESSLLYLFDEPTTGLHYYDIKSLISAFDTLIKRGHSVCIIEHNLEVIRCADYIIDLGPEGGDEGGYVVYAGPQEGILRVKESYTGIALNKYLKRKIWKS